MKEEGKSSIATEKQKISLPLMPDYLDRPRQIVNHEQGKEAITEYEVLDRIDATHLRLALYPKTGRTHQLRVHCAHHEGLNAPILGDPLYGNEKASRLHLHAEEITFEHPLTGKEINIKREADLFTLKAKYFPLRVIIFSLKGKFCAIKSLLYKVYYTKSIIQRT